MDVALAFGVYPRLFAKRWSPATKATSTSPGFGAVTEAMAGAGARPGLGLGPSLGLLTGSGAGAGA